MAIAKGTQVRQVLPAPIEGTITAYTIDQESGEVQYLVEWTNDDGDHSRFFKESEFAVVATPE